MSCHPDQWEMPCECQECDRTVELNDMHVRPGSCSLELSLCPACHREAELDIEAMDNQSIETGGAS